MPNTGSGGQKKQKNSLLDGIAEVQPDDKAS
jgi:hypothetical protein